MNSQQIKILLENYRPLKGVFEGVFAADNIKIPAARRPFCFVANTMRAGTAGEHWIACYSASRDTIEYFDSLAEQPNSNLEEILSQFPKLKMNRTALQSLFTETCGHYCICFLVMRQRKGANFERVMRRLYAIPTGSERERYVKTFTQELAASTI